MTLFKRAPAPRPASPAHGATTMQPQPDDAHAILERIRAQAAGGEPVLVERCEALGEDWHLVGLPAGGARSWSSHAVLLEQRAAAGGERLLLVRQDRYHTSAGVNFRREIRQHTSCGCLCCMATAAVLDALLDGRHPAAATGPWADCRSVSNPEQRGYDIIARAIALDASDIHIEVEKEGRFAPRFRLRMRVNGKLRTLEEGVDAASVAALENVVTALFQNPRIAADAEKSHSTFNPLARCFASIKPPVRNAELRFESNPTVAGYKVVIRLLSYLGKTAGAKSLESLGFSGQMEQSLLRACRAPSGLVLVVGATGAGKTSTIATALEADASAHEKVRIGMEIPPEIGISELSQYRVTLETLADVAVGVARSDPDVIYAGEINNHATAVMAQDYALTGHLTLATFHANSAAAALMRLIGDSIRMDPAILGMERFLRAVLYQSLVPLLCPDCRAPAREHLSREQAQVLTMKFHLDLDGMFVRHPHAAGEPLCPRCHGSGETGRTAIAELIVPDRAFLDLVIKRDINGAMDHYRSQRVSGFDAADSRGKTFVEHALGKAARGLICADAIFDGVEDLYAYELRPLKKLEVIEGCAVQRPARAGEGR